MAFSGDGKLKFSQSLDIGASAGKSGKQVGLGVSAEQVDASVDLNTGERGNAEPMKITTVIGAKNKTTGGNATPEGFELGEEEGEGALGGGSISITKEGVSELGAAWQELRDDVGDELSKILTAPIAH